VVANDILSALSDVEKAEARYRDICWSLLAPDDCVRMGADYVPAGRRLDAAGAFASDAGEPAEVRLQNCQDSIAWYAEITADMFAKTAVASHDRKA
jgi:hypothetical protein